MPLSWCLGGLFDLTHYGTALRQQTGVVVIADQAGESCVLYSGKSGGCESPCCYSGAHGQALAGSWLNQSGVLHTHLF